MANTAQNLNYPVQQLLASAKSFEFWQQGQHNDLATFPVSKAVTNNLAIYFCHHAWQFSVLNTLRPAFLGDAKLIQPGFGNSILASLTPDDDTSGDIVGMCGSVNDEVHYFFQKGFGAKMKKLV